MTDFDMAHEVPPNPQWLRQLASTLKLEAALLKGYAEAMPTDQPTRAAVTIIASIHMGMGHAALLELADSLDESPVAS